MLSKLEKQECAGAPTGPEQDFLTECFLGEWYLESLGASSRSLWNTGLLALWHWLANGHGLGAGLCSHKLGRSPHPGSALPIDWATSFVASTCSGALVVAPRVAKGGAPQNGVRHGELRKCAQGDASFSWSSGTSSPSILKHIGNCMAALLRMKSGRTNRENHGLSHQSR